MTYKPYRQLLDELGNRDAAFRAYMLGLDVELMEIRFMQEQTLFALEEPLCGKERAILQPLLSNGDGFTI